MIDLGIFSICHSTGQSAEAIVSSSSRKSFLESIIDKGQCTYAFC